MYTAVPRLLPSSVAQSTSSEIVSSVEAGQLYGADDAVPVDPDAVTRVGAQLPGSPSMYHDDTSM